MSITDELREVAAKTECANGRCEKLYRGDLDHAADRIDERIEREYVKLPVDADGVPIRVGDEVAFLGRMTVDATDGHNVFFFADNWADGVYCVRADELRHYHAPTVEDVLDEFFGKANLPDGTQTRAEIIAEYAARLRLAEKNEDACD